MVPIDYPVVFIECWCEATEADAEPVGMKPLTVCDWPTWVVFLLRLPTTDISGCLPELLLGETLPGTEPPPVPTVPFLCT